MNLGTLELQLMADMAQLERDMGEAKGLVSRSMSSIQGAADTAMKALGAIGVGLSVGAISAWASEVLDAAGAIHDMATQTGASVESLSRFQEIGRTSGTTADTIAGAMGRLAKNSALVDDEGKLAALALNAMGVSFEEFKALKPDDQLMAVAKALDGYEDGASKSAVAQALMGKEGAKLLPFLKDLASDTDTAAVLTATQAAAADELGDKMTAMRAKVQGAAASFALDLIPALTTLSGLFVPALQVAAAYFTLFVGVPAVFAAAKIAFDAAMLSISGMGTAAATASVSLLTLQTAGLALIAVFAGWQLGTWMRENFLEAQLAGVAFVEGSLVGWENLKYGAGVAWAAIKGAAFGTLDAISATFASTMRMVGESLQTLGAKEAGAGVIALSDKMRTATSSGYDMGVEIKRLGSELDTSKAKIRAITTDMADQAIAHFNSAKAADGNKKSSKELADAIEAQRLKLEAEKRAREAATAATEAARKKHEELLAGYLKTTEGIGAKVAATALELQQDDKLTAAQKDFLPILDALRTGKASYTELEKNGTLAKMNATLAIDANNEALKREAAWLKTSGDENAKFRDSTAAATDAIRAQIEKQEEANTQAGLSKEAIARLEIAKLNDKAATLERNAAIMAEIDLNLAGEFDAQAEALRRLAGEKEKGIHIQAARDSADAWKKTTDSIYDGLTDSLFRAFESGKGFFSTLWNGIKNVFKTTVLKMTIEGTVNLIKGAVGNTLSNLVGLPGGSTGSSASSAVSNASSINTLIGTIGQAAMGTTVGASMASIGYANAVGAIGGDALGALIAANGGWAGVSVGAAGTAAAGTAAAGTAAAGTAAAGSAAAGSGIMSSMAAAGPYVMAAIAAIMIAQKLFGSKGGPKIEGGFNSAGFGGLAVNAGGAGAAEAAGIMEGLQGSYTQYASALGGTAGTLTGAAFFGKDPKGTAMTQLVLDAAINGKEVFSRGNRSTGGNVENVGRTDAEFASAVAEAQIRALLASLKATTFSDAEVAARIAAIDAGASAESISAQIQAVTDYKTQKDAAAASAATPTTTVADTSPLFDTMGGVSPAQANSMVDYLGGINTKLDGMQLLVDGQAQQTRDMRAGDTLATALLGQLVQLIDKLTAGGTQLRTVDETAQPVLTNTLVELIAVRTSLAAVIDSSNRFKTIETP